MSCLSIIDWFYNGTAWRRKSEVENWREIVNESSRMSGLERKGGGGRYSEGRRWNNRDNERRNPSSTFSEGRSKWSYRGRQNSGDSGGDRPAGGRNWSDRGRDKSGGDRFTERRNSNDRDRGSSGGDRLTDRRTWGSNRDNVRGGSDKFAEGRKWTNRDSRGDKVNDERRFGTRNSERRGGGDKFADGKKFTERKGGGPKLDDLKPWGERKSRGERLNEAKKWSMKKKDREKWADDEGKLKDKGRKGRNKDYEKKRWSSKDLDLLEDY